MHVGAQPIPVGHIGLPGHIAGMMIRDGHLPLLTRQFLIAGNDAAGLVQTPAHLRSPEHVRPTIGGVGQEIVDRRVGRLGPADDPRAGGPARQPQTIRAQRQHHLTCRTQLVEPVEHSRDRGADRLIPAEHHPVVLVVVQPDRQQLAQLAPRGLVPQPGIEPRPQHVQLGLAHRALQPKHEPVVVVTGVIHPVRVGDQGVGHRAQVQQVIPVCVAARQPRHFDAQHQADLPQPDRGDQSLKPSAGVGIRPRTAQVVIDHPYPVSWPPQVPRSLRQFVLPVEAFGVLPHLRHRRLPHIHPGFPPQMRGPDLAQLSHRCRPRPAHPWRSSGPAATTLAPVWVPAAAPSSRRRTPPAPTAAAVAPRPLS